MTLPCGCCEGTQKLTPAAIANRPGLSALACRVGTHATFLETMQARLSNLVLEIAGLELNEHGRPKSHRIYLLQDLRTREASDAAIALLDAWATVADVLSFYQERIANEGYLRTATERHSILELARLVGYTLRPGVASTVYLAYTLDEDRSTTPPKPTAVTIPDGARAQSVPGPGELPQSFESTDKLDARSEWNNLRPRLSRPQTEESIRNATEEEPQTTAPRVYLKGIATNLKQDDPLLIVFGEKGDPELFRIIGVEPDAAADRTLVKLLGWTAAVTTAAAVAENVKEIVARHTDAIKTTGLANLAIVKRVRAHLNELETHLTAEQPVADLMTHLEKVTLPNVITELPAAEAHARNSEITPVLEGLVGDLTKITERFSAPAMSQAVPTTSPANRVIRTDELLGPLLKSPSLSPASSARLGRDVSKAFADKADTGLQLLSAFQPALSEALPTALANAKVTEESGIKVYALRVTAAPFGNIARKRTRFDRASGEVIEIGEWPIIQWRIVHNEVQKNGHIEHEKPNSIYLDSSYDKIIADSATTPSWIVIDTSAWESPKEPRPQVTPIRDQPLLIAKIAKVQSGIVRADYGMSGKTTRIEIEPTKPWLTIHPRQPPNPETAQAVYDVDFRIIRSSAVYAQSEELALAEEPVEEPVCGGKDTPIELDGLYSGLQSGSWSIVFGERTDIRNDAGVVVPGVTASELVMLATVRQDVRKISSNANGPTELPGDKLHTFIQLAEDLAYCYKRDKVVIYGNVVKATHGERRNEVLGSGDGSKALQHFTLRQPPLTFVSAANPAGVESTLKVYVNEVQWHETDSLAGLVPTNRNFVTRTDDEGKTSVTFGNGRQGARLPTGQENVKAAYRNGIGKAGNVKADQITLLATRPLGVKAVTNPIRAAGGADRENRDQARQNAPLAVLALDRLVSTQDYADFARTFAGIGKASAVRLSDGRHQLVHVTIAGADDVPIEKTSGLYRNLVKALHDFGDPYLPIQVEMRQLMLVVIQANVRVMPDHQWDSVESQIRAALLQAFSFERRDLGQDALLSEAISVMQRLEGTAYVDVDVFGGIPSVDPETGIPITPNRITQTARKLVEDPKRPYPRVTVNLAAKKNGSIRPAQLAILTPDVPAAIILNEVTQ